jgi:hypothetical protein
LPESFNRGWYVAGITTLLVGVAVGWFVLRPMPRPPTIDPDPGYLIVDTTSERSAAGAERGAAQATEGAAAARSPASEIALDTPQRGSLVASPMWIVGRARGTWYFEAEFPVKLFDARDTLLTFGSARADGEWTTKDFVPFALTLNFAEPTTDTGTLVLEKSNPSGLPEHAAEIRIPVRFR